MAKPFGKTLLGLVAALVAAGALTAQQSVKDAILKLRMGEKEEARTMLLEVISADPSAEEALQLIESIDRDAWMRLRLEGGEFTKVVESLHARAAAAQAERSRDQGEIDGLVSTILESADYGERRAAIATLVNNHAEFAVPALVKNLGSDDDEVLARAHVALRAIGRMATPALIATLSSGEPTVRANAAAAISNIGDRRGAAAISGLLSDEYEAVSDVAARILKSWGVTDNAAALHLANARSFLSGSGVMAGEASEVVWAWSDSEGLVSMDVPRVLYPYELAKSSAVAAMRADSSNPDAASVLAQAYLAQVAVIDRAGDEVGDVADQRGSLRRVALATGPKVLGEALAEARGNRQIPVAVAAIEALADCAGAADLTNSSLVSALDDGDARIAHAAALAIVGRSNGTNLPAAGAVVNRLAAAVQQRATRIIQMVAPETVTAGVAIASGNGKIVGTTETSGSAIPAIFSAPAMDAIVINEVLPDQLPENLISVIRRDSKFAETKILIITKDAEAAGERFDGMDVAFVDASLSGAEMVAAIDEAIGSEMGPQQERAEAGAIKAAGALAKLAQSGVDLGAEARATIRGQLDRGAPVVLPAVHALAANGDASDLGALMGVLGGGADDAIKVAAANAAGSILGRMNSEIDGESMAALLAILGGDASDDVKTAVATALGKAKKSSGDVLKLIDKLGASPSVDG